jgi:hypothetical protein
MANIETEEGAAIFDGHLGAWFMPEGEAVLAWMSTVERVWGAGERILRGRSDTADTL